MEDFFQINISLNYSNPTIWRQIHLHKSHTFFELHHIIQITMGWHNYHMYEFNVEGYRIGAIYEDEKVDGFDNNNLLDSATTKLCDVVSSVGDVIKYEYDFGDSWEHTIVVEAFLIASSERAYPMCIAGEMACPPEDSGGIYGHYSNLEILKDKKHPHYKQTKIWMPRGYNPDKFNIDKINKKLDKLDNYISKWLRG
jgi:hypothetical protein